MLHLSVCLTTFFPVSAHRFTSSSPRSVTSNCERASKQPDYDGGRREALLDRRPTLLSTSPLGPAQPPQRGRAEPGGAAAAPHFAPPHGQRLAGPAQVLHTDISDIQPMR